MKLQIGNTYVNTKTMTIFTVDSLWVEVNDKGAAVTKAAVTSATLAAEPVESEIEVDTRLMKTLMAVS